MNFTRQKTFVKHETLQPIHFQSTQFQIADSFLRHSKQTGSFKFIVSKRI